MPACVAAVEPLPGGGVGEPEVGAAVDDHDVVRRSCGGERAGLAVRQGEEDDVVPGERLELGRLEHPVGQRHQVGLEGAERLARVGGAGQGADLDLGVGRAAGAAPRRRRTRWRRRPRPVSLVMCMTIQTHACSCATGVPEDRARMSVGPAPSVARHDAHSPAATYLDHLRAESARFRAVLTACDPAARVPGLPGLGRGRPALAPAEVQWFWADGRSAPTRPGRPRGRRAGAPARTTGCSRRSTSHSAALVDALDAADPAEPAVVAGRTEQTVGLHLPPPGPRGADPPARRRADRRARSRRSTRRWPPTASPSCSR